jgi:hypothetical protein
MTCYVTALVLSVFALGAWAQNPVPHQHSVAPANLIDGSKNPELVPDSTAYRLFLLNHSVPTNSSEEDRKIQSAHLAKAKLDVNDWQPVLTVLASFRSQYDAWLSRYNAAATGQGASFDPTPFLQQREDLVQSTRDMLKRSLSAVGMLRLDAHVQTEKKFMQVAAN